MMNKIKFILIVISAILLLTACRPKNAISNNDSSTNENITEELVHPSDEDSEKENSEIKESIAEEVKEDSTELEVDEDIVIEIEETQDVGGL